MYCIFFLNYKIKLLYVKPTRHGSILLTLESGDQAERLGVFTHIMYVPSRYIRTRVVKYFAWRVRGVPMPTQDLELCTDMKQYYVHITAKVVLITLLNSTALFSYNANNISQHNPNFSWK